MKIISVIETNENLVTIAPFCNAISNYNRVLNGDQNVNSSKIQIKSPEQKEKIAHILVDFGQSSDSGSLGLHSVLPALPIPDINLNTESGNYAEQIGKTIIAFEQLLLRHQPNWIILLSNTKISMACAVTAKKQNIKVCVIDVDFNYKEKTINEKINYLITNHLSDLILTSDKISIENLHENGIDPSRISLVGNIKIDIFESNRKIASSLSLENIIRKNIVSECSFPDTIPDESSYDIVTLQLPMNIDNLEVFRPLAVFLLNQVTKNRPMLWIIDPHTRKQLIKLDLWEKANNIDGLILLKPVSNIEMLRLIMGAHLILEDSLDLQKECNVLGINCIILRWKTENPITLRENGGTTILVGNDIEQIKKEYLNTQPLIHKSVLPDLWDGRTAERCLEAILRG